MPLLPDSCDHCCKKLNNGKVLICRHEKGLNVFTSDKQDKTPTEENETVEEVEANRSQKVHAELLIALIHVNTCW
ncbi:hypothetical protein RhiirA4_407603 [Rhizophagus irregularis]|uniref:Uncharacterized protein n=1 Tax=Rhizophagus irregularis TaxID=588596 RepID=A0A2I1FWM9_9GLOM|nr:hypothetical protein RhiirA4_392515 [Rhizophagus irregularis]PKY51648.1 hypothetical protein RhiirA4_407603 [Rhizophagus irregularis]